MADKAKEDRISKEILALFDVLSKEEGIDADRIILHPDGRVSLFSGGIEVPLPEGAQKELDTLAAQDKPTKANFLTQMRISYGGENKDKGPNVDA